MDKKKIFQYGAIVLGIFFAFALLESGIRWSVQKVNEYSKETEIKKQEEMTYHSDLSQTQREITKYLDTIIDAIREKDYQYIYANLDDDYKKYMFHDKIEELEKYLQEKVAITEQYEYIRMNHNGGMYQVLVGTSNGEVYSSQSFTVKLMNDNEFSLMFDEYYIFEVCNNIANYNNIVYQLSYYYETPAKSVYVLDIMNGTSDNIEIDFKNASKLIGTNGKEHQGDIPQKVMIQSNESERRELVFNKYSEGKSYIEFDVNINNVAQNVVINLVRDIM